MNLRKISALVRKGTKTKICLNPIFSKKRLFKNHKKYFSEKLEDDLKSHFENLKFRIKKEFNNNPKRFKWMGALLFFGMTWVFLKYYLYPVKKYEELESLLLSGDIENLKIYHSRDFTRSFGFCVVNINGKNYRIDLEDWKQFLENLAKIEKTRNIRIVVELNEEASFKFYLSNMEMVVRLVFYFSLFMLLSSQKSFNQFSMPQIEKSGKKFTKEMSKVKFQDVAGMEESKNEIVEFVDFLQNPERYKRLGAKLPKGALLAGPPGTGKTLLAKACAGEAGVPFFYASGSEFIQLYVGLGASRIRELFARAKQDSPAIIFIDEIDAIGKKRQNNLGSNMESDSTLNQLLVEMDGFGTDENVIVFAATNRKELLDPALLRPGRFDRMIDVTLPDLDGRREIFEVHLTPLKLHSHAKQHHAKRLASLTPGFSGAEIANVCNEAAIEAVRHNHRFVEEIDFELAIEKVIGGLQKNNMDDPHQEKVVAVHESGHGVISWFLEGANPLLKVTIIPRSKGALGFAQYLPSEQSLETKTELHHQIIAILAGRIAEEEFFGKVTTGAYDDLEKAYRIAHALVTQLGMVTNIGYLSLEQNQYGIKQYSDFTNSQIDKAASKILNDAAIECRKLVKLYKNKIEEMSQVLLEKKTIDLNVIQQILGPRPFPLKPNFKAYLDVKTQN